jgi:hypothetical protein
MGECSFPDHYEFGCIIGTGKLLPRASGNDHKIFLVGGYGKVMQHSDCARPRWQLHDKSDIKLFRLETLAYKHVFRDEIGDVGAHFLTACFSSNSRALNCIINYTAIRSLGSDWHRS